MASIDKIYGTQKQYDELYYWLKENRPSAIRYLYMREGWMPKEERPISNFPRSVDKWLLKNCPLNWVRERIKEQYSITNKTDDMTVIEITRPAKCKDCKFCVSNPYRKRRHICAKHNDSIRLNDFVCTDWDINHWEMTKETE